MVQEEHHDRPARKPILDDYHQVCFRNYLLVENLKYIHSYKDVMVPCLPHHAASEISYFPLILFLSFLSHFLGWEEVDLGVSLENSCFFNKVFSFCFTELQGHFMSGKFNGSLIPSNAELMAKLPPLSKGCLLALVPFNQSILAPCLTFLLASYVEIIIKQFLTFFSLLFFLSWKPCCILNFLPPML